MICRSIACYRKVATINNGTWQDYDADCSILAVQVRSIHAAGARHVRRALMNDEALAGSASGAAKGTDACDRFVRTGSTDILSPATLQIRSTLSA